MREHTEQTGKRITLVETKALEKEPRVPGSCFGVATVVFLGGIGGGLVFPILPILGLKFGLSAVLIGFILAANRISRLLVNPLSGALVDRIGGKIPLTTGLLVESGATICYSAGLFFGNPAAWFLIGRIIWGIGSSLLIVSSMAIALNLSNQGNRGRMTASVRMAFSLGLPTGLLVGGVIAGVWSDNAAFLTAAVLTFLAAGISIVSVPHVHPARAGSSPGRLRRDRRRAWKIDRELIDLVLDLRVVTVWIYNFLIFLTMQGLLLTTLVLFVKYRKLDFLGLGVQPLSGVLMAVMMIWSGGFTVLIGRMLDRIDFRTGMVAPAVICLILGFGLLAFGHSLPAVLSGLIFMGAGMGGTNVPLLTLLGDMVRPDLRGRAMGIYQIFGDCGGSLGPIVGVAASTRFGFAWTYSATAMLLFLSLPLALYIYRTERCVTAVKTGT